MKGTYTVNQNNKGLYTIAWGTNQQRLDKTTLLIKLSASKSTIVDGKTYLYGTVNNQTGWIALKDLTNASSFDTVEDYNDDLVITNGNSFTMTTLLAKGYSLKPFNEQIFQVTKRKVVNGITWYYGKLSNGKSVWIKKSDLQQQLVKLSKTIEHLMMSLKFNKMFTVHHHKFNVIIAVGQMQRIVKLKCDERENTC